ncbi:WecB/TagA/CpsF family glycosyltransferase [Sporolactobacillus sp. Y61]|uniref:WecB/TagA/CpsF family glycosyltransferase n=1 Tax=Sporolactobacillus sp. Y61 TaxID=3160863 RepID=A0AAU8II75_9BACL
MEKVDLFGISFNKVTIAQMIAILTHSICNNQYLFIQTANVDHIILTQNDKLFREIVQSANIITCDGMPIIWASRLLKNPLPERVTGADLTTAICKYSFKRFFNLFILGAAPGVAEKAKRMAELKYPGCHIVGVYSPSCSELADSEKSRNICEQINRSGSNILLLALGTPKQEKWYWQNKKRLHVNAIIGVGAAIDFLAGTKKRAPKWMRDVGLEWLYRLTKEPVRLFRRYMIRDLKIIPLFARELIKQMKVRSEQ